MRALVRDLAAVWRARGRRKRRVEAVIAHALRFETWQSLARQEDLRDDDVASLMVSLARAAAYDGAAAVELSTRGVRHKPRRRGR